MSGMKEGAGEDPFAEDDSEEEALSEDRETAEPTPETEAAHRPERGQRRAQQTIQIPYKFRRDGVQDGRDRVPLFLKPDTKRDERDARRDLEDRLDEDVSLTDLREALVKTGLEHLDEVEIQLEEWGYGMTFD